MAVSRDNMWLQIHLALGRSRILPLRDKAKAKLSKNVMQMLLLLLTVYACVCMCLVSVSVCMQGFCVEDISEGSSAEIQK